MADRPPRPAAALVRRPGWIALAVGAAAGVIGALAAPAAPWWMAPFLGVVAAALVWRLLRPRPRRPGWEDEI